MTNNHIPQLEETYSEVMKAVSGIAKNLQEYPASPYTAEQVVSMGKAADTLEPIGREIRAWKEVDNG